MKNKKRIIILGIGNPILGDDGIGIHVVQKLKKQLDKRSNIVIDEAMTGGMNLLDAIIGFDKAILIDAVHLTEYKIGEVKCFQLSDLETIHSCNPHDVTLIESIQLAKTLGEEKIPHEIIIIGIVLHQLPTDFSEELSPMVASAIPKAIQMVFNEIT
jgi:hydrogenase maturation protease